MASSPNAVPNPDRPWAQWESGSRVRFSGEGTPCRRDDSAGSARRRPRVRVWGPWREVGQRGPRRRGCRRAPWTASGATAFGAETQAWSWQRSGKPGAALTTEVQSPSARRGSPSCGPLGRLWDQCSRRKPGETVTAAGGMVTFLLAASLAGLVQGARKRESARHARGGGQPHVGGAAGLGWVGLGRMPL